MEKISRTVYPTEPITLEQWWKEFNIGRLASKSNHQAQEMMASWQDKEGNKSSFKIAIGKLLSTN